LLGLRVCLLLPCNGSQPSGDRLLHIEEEMSGQQIRTMHPDGFRSGAWAELLTTVPAPETLGDIDRSCYLVRFPDGVEDFWVVGDPDGQYEFRGGVGG
jgi:hypothetical protein